MMHGEQQHFCVLCNFRCCSWYLLLCLTRNCPRCKKPRKASKQLSISRLPPILLIHLKRFSFKGPFSDRIDSVVHFPLTGLDLTNLLPPPLPPPSQTSSASYKENLQHIPPPQSPQSVKYSYDLYGVSNHFGTLSSGHCQWL
jgi:ubiquitin carboxyl-terminal hydrolase 8